MSFPTHFPHPFRPFLILKSQILSRSSISPLSQLLMRKAGNNLYLSSFLYPTENLKFAARDFRCTRRFSVAKKITVERQGCSDKRGDCWKVFRFLTIGGWSLCAWIGIVSKFFLWGNMSISGMKEKGRVPLPCHNMAVYETASSGWVLQTLRSPNFRTEFLTIWTEVCVAFASRIVAPLRKQPWKTRQKKRKRKLASPRLPPLLNFYNLTLHSTSLVVTWME